MQKRWNISEADNQVVTSLYESLKVPKVLCKIFVQRGIDTYEKAKDFFRPQLTELTELFPHLIVMKKYLYLAIMM